MFSGQYGGTAPDSSVLIEFLTPSHALILRILSLAGTAGHARAPGAGRRAAGFRNADHELLTRVKCSGFFGSITLYMNRLDHDTSQASRPIRPLPNLIFMSRWLQLPLYLGLILAQGVYVYHFWVELVDLIGAALGNQAALDHILQAVAIKGGVQPTKLNETTIMLVVLGLIDVVMISNLLIMVIVGGYETFVSRMNLESHPDQPEWLSHVNASVLKVKLATAIIGISSIHLLKTFINAGAYDAKTLIAQTGIHLAFLMSAMAIAYCDKIMSSTTASHSKHIH
jgi:uncharacterized protein (TIGR00645 family)